MVELEMQSADFQITAQLSGLITKDGDRIKYLRVMLAEREYWVKIPKELSRGLNPYSVDFQVGSWLEIVGVQTIDRKKGILKLVASSFSNVNTPVKDSSAAIQTEAIAPKKQSQKQINACILICQKSDCWQRGGKEVYQNLEKIIQERGLSDQIQLQKTGCQKQCKKAPNLVVMPNKSRHSFVRPTEAASLLDKYFSNISSKG
ncbi:MAG: (Fe-S)-binding protein [Pseudanabaena sp.]|nr:MAG: (Fe-S)-binding protein [Pseudanabaena sp.]